MASLTGTFSTAGLGASGTFQGHTNFTLTGSFVGTVQPERSFDGGGVWAPLCFQDGAPRTWSTPTSTTLLEPEFGVLYRLNCTDLRSGSISWRISQ